VADVRDLLTHQPQTKKSIRAAGRTSRALLDQATLVRRSIEYGRLVDAFARARHARTVTLYASVGGEPGTRIALETLHSRGVRVLLPIVLPDLDLDWAVYDPNSWKDGPMGLVEPASAPLGVDAIREADIVFCPGVAGGLDGSRLGRGGGCYDRALARTRDDTVRALVVYEDEVLDSVPTDPHDQRVDWIITPTRVIPAEA
jgi:5-formyltetrahydrofolate cyclo-ligase